MGESGWAGRFDLSRRDNIAAIQRADSTDEMQHSHLLPSSLGLPPPERFLSRLVGFADLFTRPTWSNVLVLLSGAILAPGRRTVSAVLRILGSECDRDFCTFHSILNRAAWSSRVVARQLLIVLVKAFMPSGAPVVIDLDDTIDRRWGAKISARGIYRDPVRSSKGHFVKASGLRWLSAMLLVKIPWADRIHGVALSHPSHSLQTLLCRQDAGTQDAARLGASSRPANPPLAPRSLCCPGR